MLIKNKVVAPVKYRLTKEDKAYYAAKQAIDPSWRPLCLACRSVERMIKEAYGFSCLSCGAELYRDLTRKA